METVREVPNPPETGPPSSRKASADGRQPTNAEIGREDPKQICVGAGTSQSEPNQWVLVNSETEALEPATKKAKFNTEVPSLSEAVSDEAFEPATKRAKVNEVMDPAGICLGKLRKTLEEANSVAVSDVPADLPGKAASPTENAEDPYDFTDCAACGQAVVPAARMDLADLCARVTADGETLGHVKGRKVVIVLGRTGAGKTTFLHSVAQKRLRRERLCAKDIFVAAEAMEGFNIGHEQASETKSIRHYERVCQDSDGEPVVYVDTPGYKDSDGPMIDLATSVSLRRVASICGQLRFAVLINTASFLERGEAIKEVASLISSFVGDFEENRFVFTFLFTHTDSVKETEGVSMETVKATLIEWLGHTWKGATCPKTKAVLGWMRRCLEKQLPFADVFHPEHSTTKSLVASVEQFQMLPGDRQAALGLTPGKSAREVVRCGMTGAEESTLKLELDSLLGKLRDALHNERLGVFPGLVKILWDLSEYIGNKVTCMARDEGQALITRKVEALAAELEKLMLQGVDPSSCFSVAMGRRSLENMAVLDAFSDLGVAGMAELVPKDAGKGPLLQLRSNLDWLCRSVSSELKDPNNSDFASIEARLQRLQVWAEVHQEFAPLSRAGLDAAREWIATAVQAGREEEEEETLVSALARLASVLLQSSGLMRLGLGQSADAAQEVFTGGSQRLRLRITEAFAQAEAAIKQVEVSSAEGEGKDGSKAPADSLRVFQSESANLERLAGMLGGHSILHELGQTAAGACSALQKEVHRVVRALHDGVVEGTMGDGSRACSTEELACRVSIFRNVLRHLTEQQRAHTSAQSLFDDALQQPLADVARLAADIRQRIEMLRTSSVAVPEKHMQPLQALAQRTWLDQFSHGLDESGSRTTPEKLSVTALLAEFEGSCFVHFQESAQKVVTALEAYLEKPRHGEEHLTEAQRLLPQIRSASCFLSVFPRIESIQLQLETQLHALIQGWSQERRQTSAQSAGTTLASSSDVDANGETLRVCSALSFVKSQDSGHALDDLSSYIKMQLQPCAEHASNLMSAQGQFREKRELLDRLTSWEKDGLSEMLGIFPALATVQATVNREVEDLSTRARAAITGGVDMGLAKTLLQQLKEAQHLDDYLGGMARRDFVLLEELLKLQHTRLEEGLRKKIESCNFAGFQDRLAPLLSSDDLASKEHLKEIVECIRSSISSRAAAAHATIQSGLEVASHVRVLQRASADIGKLLWEHTSLDVDETVNKLKVCIQEQCQERLSRLETALNPLDGQSLLTRCSATQSYLIAVSGIVGDQLVARIVETVLHRLKCVLPLSKNFLRDVSTNSDENIDASELAELLHQLQLECAAAADETQSETQNATAVQCCADLYSTATQRLREGLNELHRKVCQGRKDNHLNLMAVRVYTNLKRASEAGVLCHVEGLEFDISAELEKAQGEDKLCLLDQTWSLDSIKSKWVPLFSKLHSDSCNSVKTLFGCWALPEYTEKCRLLAQGVQEVLSQAVCQLKAGDFERARSSATILCNVCDALGGHILDPQAKAATETLAADIQQRCQKFREDLWEALCSTSTASTGAYEMLFLRYHEFMYHLAPRFKRVLSDTAYQVHADMLRTLEAREQDFRAKIEALDFVAAAEEVRTLRQLGQVLTGIFAVYQEDLEHLVDDDCLRRVGEFSTRRFGGKALAGLGCHFAVLQAQPHASQKEIKQAYRRRCLECHPDTHARRGVHHSNPSAMQQRVQQAYDELSKPRVQEEYQRGLSEPFSSDIRELGRTLTQRLDAALNEARYKHVHDLLRSVEHLRELADLASPGLDSKLLCCQLCKAVKCHTEAVRKSLFTSWDKRQLGDVQKGLTRLRVIEEHLSSMDCGDECRTIVKAVEREIQGVSSEALADLGDRKPTEASRMHFARVLLRLGHILDQLTDFKDSTVETINSMLVFCQHKFWGHTFLFHVGMLLERGSVGQPDDTGAVSSEDQRIGRVVVSEFRQFKEVLTVVWNEQTEVTQKDVSATVQEIVAKQVIQGGTNELEINRDKLMQCYTSYLHEYDTQFHRWRAGQLDLPKLASETKSLASELPTCSTNSWGPVIRGAVPKLLGRVFSYFTISQSGESYTRLSEASEVDLSASNSKDESLNPENLLRKPHNMQVISILQMLGCSDPDGTHLSNHLMQIRTGEGKSIVLGGCAAVLGLLGFQVRAVCYSKYLSRRDWNLFHGVFSAFGVTDRVTYGQINTIYWENIEGKRSPEALTLDLLRGGKRNFRKKRSYLKKRSYPASDGEKILLVDEVDVFFGPDFYGETLNMVAELEAAEVETILQEVWNSRKEAPHGALARVKALPSYQRLADRLPEWQFVIESEVEQMCHDVLRFNSPPYHFDRVSRRIGYQELDSVDYGTTYGYCTAFAYFHEVSNMGVSNPTRVLREAGALCLRVPCGNFSYANIKPACILGVSGTISAFGAGDYEWQVLNRYGVQTYCEMPSVYGKSKLRTLDQEDVKPIVVSDNKDDWFLAITDQVNEMASRGRASIVVFQLDNLEEYKASAYFKKVLNKSELRESLTHEERESVIKKAALPGQTTFISEAFGRGSDFFCFDRSLQDNGGVHVIMTSFPLEKSLEMQIDGRTARQGQKGSRAMVLLAEDLSSTFEVSLTSIRVNSQPSALYELLDKARAEHHRKKCEEVEQDLQAATEQDSLSHAYLDALLAGDRAAALKAHKDLYDKIGWKA